MKSGVQIPLDLLFLSVLIPAHMHLKGISFLMVIPLFGYIMLELWHPLASYTSLPDKFDRTRLVFLIRLFLIFIIIAGSVIVPTLTNIQKRLVTAPDASGYSEAYANIHDGAIQMEYALRFLSDGKNPYVERYEDTPLKYYGFSGINPSTNPAFDHFVYLPGFLITSFPIYKLFDQLGFLYDQRWIYLLAYVVLVLLLPPLVKQPTLKLSLLAAVGLNPLLTGPVIIGMNDVAVILPIVLSLFALSRKRFLLSAIAFGFACTFKQSAWFFAPFYILILFASFPQAERFKQTIKYLFVAGLAAFIIVGPFAMWSLSDFVTDVFLYPSGAVDVNYPIRGYTIGVLLVGVGWIGSPLDPFPFWTLQLVVGIPLLVWLLKFQWRQNRMGIMFICAGVFIFGIGLASRFFQDNYVGFVIIFILLGFLLNLSEDGKAIGE